MEIDRHNYSAWKLQHLVAVLLDRNDVELASPSCNTALVLALPGIQTLNSAARSDYPRSSPTASVTQ